MRNIRDLGLVSLEKNGAAKAKDDVVLFARSLVLPVFFALGHMMLDCAPRIRRKMTHGDVFQLPLPEGDEDQRQALSPCGNEGEEMV